MLPCASVYAQQAEKCPKRPAAEKRAKRWAGRWFIKAEKAVKSEKYDVAMDRFLCSLYMAPHENTVFNIAQLTNLVEEKESALTKLEAFTDKNPDHESTPEIKELIGSVERSMGLEEDEEEISGPLDAEIVADEPEEDEADARDGPNLKVPAYILLGTAGATLILSISLQAAAGAAQNDAEAATDYDGYLYYEDKMRGRQVGATVCFVLTGLIAGTGVLLLLLDKDGEASADGEASVDLSLLPAPARLVLQGSF